MLPGIIPEFYADNFAHIQQRVKQIFSFYAPRKSGPFSTAQEDTENIT